MLIFRLLNRRRTYEQFTRRLNLDMRLRLLRALLWLLGLAGLHVAAMMMFEGLGPADSIWLTLTTLTTVGYGDVSAVTIAGRTATVVLLYVAGITLLAQLASDYIDYRLQRKDFMIRGRWDWQMNNHVLIIHSPANNPSVYFQRLVAQLRETSEYADTPVQILTDDFPDGLPDELRAMGVLHHHGESSDIDTLKRATPEQAHAIIILARDEYRRISDSVTLDVLLQLKSLCNDRLPFTAVECVSESNRQRARLLGANTTLRAIRAYPEILVRALVAPGSEKILENLFTHHDDHAMRYDVALQDKVWSDAVCRIMSAGLGTLMAYVTDDNEIVCHPAHDHRFDCRGLIVIVRAEAIPSASDVKQCLQQ